MKMVWNDQKLQNIQSTEGPRGEIGFNSFPKLPHFSDVLISIKY